MKKIGLAALGGNMIVVLHGYPMPEEFAYGGRQKQ
jgi:hypothetical protein